MVSRISPIGKLTQPQPKVFGRIGQQVGAKTFRKRTIRQPGRIRQTLQPSTSTTTSQRQKNIIEKVIYNLQRSAEGKRIVWGSDSEEQEALQLYRKILRENPDIRRAVDEGTALKGIARERGFRSITHMIQVRAGFFKSADVPLSLVDVAKYYPKKFKSTVEKSRQQSVTEKFAEEQRQQVLSGEFQQTEQTRIRTGADIMQSLGTPKLQSTIKDTTTDTTIKPTVVDQKTMFKSGLSSAVSDIRTGFFQPTVSRAKEVISDIKTGFFQPTKRDILSVGAEFKTGFFQPTKKDIIAFGGEVKRISQFDILKTTAGKERERIKTGFVTPFKQEFTQAGKDLWNISQLSKIDYTLDTEKTAEFLTKSPVTTALRHAPQEFFYTTDESLSPQSLKQMEKKFYTKTISGTKDYFRGFGTELKEHPYRTAITTGVFFALPFGLGAVGRGAGAIGLGRITSFLGKVSIGALPTLYGASVGFRVARADKKGFELGKITAGEFLPMFAGGYAGAHFAPRFFGWRSSLGRTELDVKAIVPGDVLFGRTRFPKAPPSRHLQLFLKQSQRLPGIKEPMLFHATSRKFWDTSFEAIAGSSEFKGLYGGYGVSPNFLRLLGSKKLYGGNLFESYGQPSVLAIIPKGFRTRPYRKIRKGKYEFLGRTIKDVADVPQLKTEVESILAPSTKGPIISEDYFFRYKGYRIPIDVSKLAGKPFKTPSMLTKTKGGVGGLSSYYKSLRSPILRPSSFLKISYSSFKPSRISSITKPSSISRIIKPSSSYSYLPKSRTVSYPRSSYTKSLFSRSFISSPSISRGGGYVEPFLPPSRPPPPIYAMIGFRGRRKALKFIKKSKIKAPRRKPSLVALGLDIWGRKAKHEKYFAPLMIRPKLIGGNYGRRKRRSKRK